MSREPDTSFGTRKRNNRCLNKICACTGACFIDDGTGDFAKPSDERIKLERLRSRMLGWDDCDWEINQLKSEVTRLAIRDGLFDLLMKQIAVYAGRKDGGLSALQSLIYHAEKGDDITCECCGVRSKRIARHLEDCPIILAYEEAIRK